MNGQDSAEGFGTWNNDVKEPKKDREQRQRERKSRWGDAEPEETAETNIPELETCEAPAPVTDNTDMDIEAEVPEPEITRHPETAEAQHQENVPCDPTEQMFQPPIQEPSVQEEQMFQPQTQETADAAFQDNDHANPSESMQPSQNPDFEDIAPAPEAEDPESANPPLER